MAKEVSAPKVDVEKISETPDLSLIGLIGDADFFVQFIMFLLLVASVWCWTIILNKSKTIRRERKLKSQNSLIVDLVLKFTYCFRALI